MCVSFQCDVGWIVQKSKVIIFSYYEIKEIDYSHCIGKICDITIKSFMKKLYRNSKIVLCDQDYTFY